MPPAYLTNEDVQNYGSDFVDFAQRAAAHVVAPQIQQLQEENHQLQQRLAREARHRLDAAVAQAVPDYENIDRDPRWHQWLLQIDPLNGVVRQQVLNDAIAAGSAVRVIAFFRGFLQAMGAGQGITRSARAAGAGGPLYTRGDVKRAYELHRQGKYRGREAEWNRIEHEIIAAGREGRILGAENPQGK